MNLDVESKLNQMIKTKLILIMIIQPFKQTRNQFVLIFIYFAVTYPCNVKNFISYLMDNYSR